MGAKLSKKEEKLLRVAFGKHLGGEALSRAEKRLVQRWEKLEHEAKRWEVYGAVPQRHYRELCGRHHQVLRQQAERYGLALEGPTVDLGKLLKQFHDLFARNWLKFGRDLEGDDLMTGAGASSPNMERYRGHKADLVALEVEVKNGELLPRAEVRQGLLVIAGVIRSAGEQLQREYGAGALAILGEALDDAEVRVKEMFEGSV